VLSLEIVNNVLAEMRAERKILMVIQDTNGIDEYINTDITQINLRKELDQDLPKETRDILMQKMAFRTELADNVSLKKLKCMFLVLRNMY